MLWSQAILFIKLAALDRGPQQCQVFIHFRKGFTCCLVYIYNKLLDRKITPLFNNNKTSDQTHIFSFSLTHTRISCCLGTAAVCIGNRSRGRGSTHQLPAGTAPGWHQHETQSTTQHKLSATLTQQCWQSAES